MIKKILISQPRPTTERHPFSSLEQDYGIECDFRQMIHIEGLSAKEFRQQHINPVEYPAIILNSKHSADHYFRLCNEMRLTVPDTMHYYCISEAVDSYLHKFIEYRKRKVFHAADNKIEGLLPIMKRRKETKYLMVLSDIYNEEQIKMFAKNNIEVQPAVMYRTVSTKWEEEGFDYDMIALFTPAGVKSVLENFPNFEQGDKVIAAFGEKTVEALEEAGLRVDIKAMPGGEFTSLPVAIKDYLEKHQGE